MSRQVLLLVRSMSKSELPEDHLDAACVLGRRGAAPKSRPLSRQTWWPPLWGPLGEARRERPAERAASPGGVLHLHPGGREVQASLPVKIKVNAASAPTRWQRLGRHRSVWMCRSRERGGVARGEQVSSSSGWDRQRISPGNKGGTEAPDPRLPGHRGPPRGGRRPSVSLPPILQVGPETILDAVEWHASRRSTQGPEDPPRLA